MDLPFTHTIYAWLGPRFAGWVEALLVALMIVILAAVVHRIGRVMLLRVVRFSMVLKAVVDRIDRPMRWVLPLLGLQLLWQSVDDTLMAIAAVRHVNALLLLAALTWLGSQAVSGIADGVIAAHPWDVADNLSARRVQTQARVISRTVIFVVLLVGLATMLMTFPGVRQVGASLLASAGVAGLVAGIAARPVISNLIAGMQIALAQPIRIDDVLIVQGEWGRVEEITGTYVVLRIWDERRLIIPLNFFMENPFQNWTRSSAEIMGSVFVWVDYRMPLQPLREEAQRICEASPQQWDGRVCILQVVEAGERAVQLRILVTSPRSDLNWDLRCAVREGLVNLMQRDYPEYLPLTRNQLRDGESATHDPRTPAGASAVPATPPV
ncbi:mechanosensitive ion channel [soil metagenome]